MSRSTASFLYDEHRPARLWNQVQQMKYLDRFIHEVNTGQWSVERKQINTQSIVAPFIIKNIYKDATMFFP